MKQKREDELSKAVHLALENLAIGRLLAVRQELQKMQGLLPKSQPVDDALVKLQTRQG